MKDCCILVSNSLKGLQSSPLYMPIKISYNTNPDNMALNHGKTKDTSVLFKQNVFTLFTIITAAVSVCHRARAHLCFFFCIGELVEICLFFEKTWALLSISSSSLSSLFAFKPLDSSWFFSRCFLPTFNLASNFFSTGSDEVCGFVRGATVAPRPNLHQSLEYQFKIQ